MDDCYHNHLYIWTGTNDEASYNQVREIYTKNALFSTSTRDKHWNSVINIYHDPVAKTWQVIVNAKFFGKKDSANYKLFKAAMDDISIAPENHCNITSDKYWCDLDPSSCLTGNAPKEECIITEHTPFANDDLLIPLLMFNVNNASALNEGFIDLMIKSWFPFCQKEGRYIGCVNNFQFRGDYPPINSTTGIFDYSTNNSLSHEFKNSAFSVYLRYIFIVKPKSEVLSPKSQSQDQKDLG